MTRLTPLVFTLAFLFTFTSASWAQKLVREAQQAPKRELRAVWIATVLNIDYPRTPSTNPIAIKEQYRNLLDQMQNLGLNAVIVQVRPAGDAFYPSVHAPWSAYLTGRQGAPPQEEFDPLNFMIEETHQRGMEFHAWINPFRASMNLDTSSLHLTHPVHQHPDWLVTYGTKMYFNPGIPEVRDHLVDVVGELVDNYEDLDGIHIDDYFYPYPIADTPFPDSTTFKFYGGPVKDINDWRRRNTDQLVQALHERIKTTRPSIQFGVSPFGVWRNEADAPRRGSATKAGVTSYDDLYADVINWINKGWIDYIMPQLYWNIGFEPADHQTLVQWWSNNSRDLPIYVGHSAYKVGNNQVEAWNDPGEIPRQIDLNRRNFQTLGSAFFSAKSLLGNPLRLKDSLRQYYAHKALWQERPELELPKLNAVDLRRPKWKQESVRLQWRPGRSRENVRQEAHYYVVYRFEGRSVGSIEDPANIYTITPIQAGDQKKVTFYDTQTRPGETYTYAVTAVNVAHMESNLSNARSILQKDANRIRVPRTKKNRERKQRTRVRRRDLRANQSSR
ncbi:MAG: family 10 glycosylhydrolase [Bacteroidota bacterium]